MTVSIGERHKLALLGWVAAIAMSLSIYPALEEKRFFVLGALLGAAVVALGMVARQFRVPSILTLLVQFAVIVEVISVGYGGHTVFGIVPTSSSYQHVHDIITAGIDVAQRYAAPAPRSAGLTLIVVAFIAAIVALVDFIAIGLNRVPLAGLPLLVLYTVPVTILPSGLPVLCFLPGAIGFVLLLLVAERDRLAHWGRHVVQSGSGSEPIDTSALSANGRRISLVALVLAVGLPMLVPGFSTALFASGKGIGPGPGSNLSFSDPMVSLAQNLRRSSPIDLLSVHSSTVPQYLRLTVLNEPTPSGWRAQPIDLSATTPVSEIFPHPTGLAQSVHSVAQQMTITPTSDFPSDSLWLPVPYDVVTLAAQGKEADPAPGLAYVPDDQTVAMRNDGVLTEVSSYQVSYDVPEPSGQQLALATPAPADIVRRYEVVPTGVPSVVGETARAVTRGATSDYQRALMLQSFFRSSSFTYDLDVGYGDGYSAMARFLQERRGYCQHFAATMAMMARTLGIPSRVVVGFLHPDKRVASGQYVFTSHDSHAWPELYFSGVGWVRFEPTPGVGAAMPPWAPKVALHNLPGIGLPTTPGAQIGHVTGLPSTAPTTVPKHHHVAASSGRLPSLWWLLIGLGVVLLFTPALLRIGVRRSRLGRGIDPTDAAENAWLELRDGLRDLGLSWTGSMSPRARQRLIEPLLGGDRESVAALRGLTLAVERARYAAAPLSNAAPADDAREVVHVISQGVSWGTRARAVLLPASLGTSVGSWLADAMARLRRTPEAPQPT